METKLALYIALVDAFVLILLMIFIRVSLTTYFSDIWELLKKIIKTQEEIQIKQKEIEEKQEVTLTHIQCK
jgi:hypothetical protein